MWCKTNAIPDDFLTQLKIAILLHKGQRELHPTSSSLRNVSLSYLSLRLCISSSVLSSVASPSSSPHKPLSPNRLNCEFSSIPLHRKCLVRPCPSEYRSPSGRNISLTALSSALSWSWIDFLQERYRIFSFAELLLCQYLGSEPWPWVPDLCQDTWVQPLLDCGVLFWRQTLHTYNAPLLPGLWMRTCLKLNKFLGRGEGRRGGGVYRRQIKTLSTRNSNTLITAKKSQLNF